MTKSYLKDARVYVGGYDLSAQHNYVSLELTRAALDETDFMDETTQINKLGLRSVRFTGRGFWDAGAEVTTTPKKIDDVLYAGLDLEDVPATIVPSIGAGIGGVAYSIKSATARIRPFLGQHGQLMSIEYDLVATSARAIRGTILARGQWGAADDDRFLVSVAMQATPYALDATTLPSGESPRCVQATHTAVGTADTLGNLVIDGTDASGTVIQETLALVSGGTAYGIKEFQTVTGLRTATWVVDGVEGTPDTIKVGYSTRGVPKQLGAVAATQKLYAVIHAYAFGGTTPTLDPKVESDNAAAFPSGIDRITFSQKTGFAYEWSELAGAVTDDWLRMVMTVGGTATPKFSVLALAAVQAA